MEGQTLHEETSWSIGCEAGKKEGGVTTPVAGSMVLTLNQHDLATIAMGIALIVLHASDIETIAATMDAQEKLGVAEQVLGWLHLICNSPEMDTDVISLGEAGANEWLNPREPKSGAGIAENQAVDDIDERHYDRRKKGGDDELSF